MTACQSELLGHLVETVGHGGVHLQLFGDVEEACELGGEECLDTCVEVALGALREPSHGVLPEDALEQPLRQQRRATRDADLVSNGVLQRYILGSYSARKLGLQTTANAGGVHNLLVTTGDDDFAAMIRRMGTGLVVTELMGQGVSVLTGDYSRGAAGFWVENGEIAYPVEEITIASNLKQMYQGIVAIGNDIDRRSHILTGSILIDRMMIAGE